MNTQIDRKGLQACTTELLTLSEVLKPTTQQRSRMAALTSTISALKLGGVTLRELDEQDLNERARAHGLPETRLVNHDSDREAEARGWRKLAEIAEQRDMTEGSPVSRIGTYTSLGFFVPTDFFPTVFAAMKAHDALFDDDACTVIHSTNGDPITIPFAADTENTASVVGEAGSQTSVDIDTTGQAVLGAYSYNTRRWAVSLESFQDLQGSLSVINLFKKFTGDALMRGIGADLVNGSGVGKTLGLIPSLQALGAPIIVASGSSANTGGSETALTSLGSVDFQAAYNAIDAAYLSSDKIAWFMNQRTLAKVANIVTKQGMLLNLVQYINGKPFIYGVPVKICPSLPDFGSGNIPVVLGDGSYWATRLITDQQSGIRVYSEAPGLIENGKVGLRTFVRAHGALLYGDTNAPSPFIMIQTHS